MALGNAGTLMQINECQANPATVPSTITPHMLSQDSLELTHDFVAIS